MYIQNHCLSSESFSLLGLALLQHYQYQNPALFCDPLEAAGKAFSVSESVSQSLSGIGDKKPIAISDCDTDSNAVPTFEQRDLKPNINVFETKPHGLPDLSNFCSLTARAGGSPCGLACRGD